MTQQQISSNDDTGKIALQINNQPENSTAQKTLMSENHASARFSDTQQHSPHVSKHHIIVVAEPLNTMIVQQQICYNDLTTDIRQ